jgi:hypothetical protein
MSQRIDKTDDPGDKQQTQINQRDAATSMSPKKADNGSQYRETSKNKAARNKPGREGAPLDMVAS